MMAVTPMPPAVHTEIRPRPRAGIRDRLYCVGMSPESVDQAALLGARLMTFTQGPWEIYADGPLKQWQALYGEHHGAPPPPLTGDLMYCHPDVKVAEERGIDAMSEYFLTIVKHYEIMSDHFKTTKGYDAYASAAEAFKAVGLETAARTYCSVNCWGDPERTIEQLRWRRDLIGDFELNLIAYYGSMTRDEALTSLELFAREVLPEVQSW